ncbi:MAG: hypothetical protein WCH76_04330, partial [Candidatus Riflemargulisbacteria bacterium]
MEQGSLSQTQSISTTAINSNSKIDVNTDTLQKLVLGAQEEAAEQAKGTEDTAKAKETISPLQHLLKGNEKEAKQELLKEFIHKVAGSERDILFSSDKGKNVDLMGELKLLFGKDSMSKDEVKLSSQARMMNMTDTVVQSQAVAALRKDMTQEDDSKKAEKTEKLEKQIFEEKKGVREKIATDRSDKAQVKEESQKNVENFDKNKYSEQDQDQDNSGKNRQNQQEVIDDKDTLAIAKLKQQVMAEVEESVEDENVVDEIEEVDVQDVQQKESKIGQVVAAAARERIIDAAVDSSETEKVQKASQEAQRTTETKTTKEEVVSKYTDHYRQFLMLPNKNLDGLMKNEEQLLKEYGLTSRQIKDVQQAVKKTIKQEIRGKIEDAIVQKQLSVGNKLDSLTADTRLNKFTDYFVSNLLLGGQDFGGFDDNFQGMVNKAMYFASKNLANFSIEQMEHFVTQESLDPSKTKVDKIKDFEVKVNELNSITNNPKVTEEWAQTAMEVFMKDYGLAREKIDVPASSTGTAVNIMSGGA